MDYVRSIEVQGSGEFPVEMLKHGKSWPARPEDAESLLKSGDESRVVRLSSLNHPDVSKWESFGWSVIKGAHMTDTSHVHINRKEYWVIFILLFLLTVLEVGVVFVPGISKVLLISALVGLALVKAAMVGWFFMHLSHDTASIRNGVVVGMAIPFFYAFVLIAEAAWRLSWTQL